MTGTSEKEGTMGAFEPVIVGFFCNWCTASAADLAGTSRMQYPPHVRPIRVMCPGSVDTEAHGGADDPGGPGAGA